MTIVIIVACVLVVVMVIFKLLDRNHNQWLDKQSPAGVWLTENDDSTITIQFEQTPGADMNEGIYKQLTKGHDGKEVKEFGHWTSHRNNLQMLIMASEIKNHPRFGQDTAYVLKFTRPEEILINGPDRNYLTYKRAPEGTVLDFDNEVDIPT